MVMDAPKLAKLKLAGNVQAEISLIRILAHLHAEMDILEALKLAMILTKLMGMVVAALAKLNLAGLV